MNKRLPMIRDTKPNWLQRLVEKFGEKGVFGSKHSRGRTKPKGWKQDKRAKRKAAHAARIITMRGK